MTDLLPMRPNQGGGCLSELEIDRLLAGDETAALRERAQACLHCRQRLAELEVARREHMSPEHIAWQTGRILTDLAAAEHALPRPGLGAWRGLARVGRRRAIRRWAALAAPVPALAAAALLLFLGGDRPPDSPAPAPDRLRLKGGSRLEVVVAAPGTPRVLVDGEGLPAGATLSFRGTCPQGCSAALFAVGRDGVHPLTAATPPPWQIEGPGHELVPLPVSATVDGPPGDDLVVAFFCAEPPDVEGLRASLQAAYGAIPAAELRANHPPTVAGCETRSVLIRRQGSTAP